MNRNNKILVGVLALIVAMTIGYALFSDNITITGTAKAKGDFQITTTCEKGLSEELKLALKDSGLKLNDGGYENDSCTVNGNEVSFHADLKYPGANRIFIVKITNTGTIDAYYNLETGREIVKERFCLDSSGDGVADDCYDRSMMIDSDVATMQKSDGTYLNDDNSADFFDEDQSNIIIKPGESMYLYNNVKFDEKLEGNSFFGTDEIIVKYNLTQKTN